MPLFPAMTALLYLVELTRSVQPEQVVSVEARRSFATWRNPERQLVGALLEQQVAPKSIAQVVYRTEQAIEEFQRRKAGVAWGRLPVSPFRLSDSDIKLVLQWPGEAQRDPLGWHFGHALPEQVLAVTEQATLRVIRVTGSDRPDSPFENELLTRTVWNDLAAQVVARGGQVVLPFPFGSEDDQKLQVRATLKRLLGRDAPLESVIVGQPRRAWKSLVLIDRPESWLLSDIAAVKASTVLLVEPHLGGHAGLTGTLPLLSFLPPGLRRDEEQREVQQASLLAQERWSEGREIETVQWSGLPNSAEALARLDWDALAWLPPRAGIISGASVQHAVRAASWYALTHGHRPSLEVSVQRQINTLWAGDVFAEESVRRQIDRLSAGGNYQDAALLRCWMDGMRLESVTSDVVFSVGRARELTYVGH